MSPFRYPSTHPTLPTAIEGGVARLLLSSASSLALSSSSLLVLLLLLPHQREDAAAAVASAGRPHPPHHAGRHAHTADAQRAGMRESEGGRERAEEWTAALRGIAWPVLLPLSCRASSLTLSCPSPSVSPLRVPVPALHCVLSGCWCPAMQCQQQQPHSTPPALLLPLNPPGPCPLSLCLFSPAGVCSGASRRTKPVSCSSTPRSSRPALAALAPLSSALSSPPSSLSSSPLCARQFGPAWRLWGTSKRSPRP